MILDITLPGINGLEACNDLRDNEKIKNINIIAISKDLRYSETEVLGAWPMHSLPNRLILKTSCRFAVSSLKSPNSFNRPTACGFVLPSQNHFPSEKLFFSIRKTKKVVIYNQGHNFVP